MVSFENILALIFLAPIVYAAGHVFLGIIVALILYFFDD
jgi:hypothetical protein